MPTSPASATGIMPDVKPENFVFIPTTGSLVYTSKACDYRGEPITSLTGYDEIRMAQRLGLNLTSSSEWGRSREFFKTKPTEKFSGKTGKEIENGYLSEIQERTSTLLAFRKNRYTDFPEDVHDLLKEAVFDGLIALIDFPYVMEDRDIFVPGPRTRIVDVSGIPLMRDSGNYIQDYDDNLGIPTRVGREESRQYHGGFFMFVAPKNKTMQIVRAHGPGYNDHDLRRFGMSTTNPGDVKNWCSMGKPLGFRLSSEKTTPTGPENGNIPARSVITIREEESPENPAPEAMPEIFERDLVPEVKPERFVLIPDTGSYVSISKNRYNWNNSNGGPSGYEKFRMAQRCGMEPISSAEWGKAVNYFLENPDTEFAGVTGRTIAKDFLSGKFDVTSTLLAYRETRHADFPEYVHDLLKEAGFDGRIALIDFPHVDWEPNIFEPDQFGGVFIPGPRTRIVDVSDILPLRRGYIQGYDADLGIPTKVGENPSPEHKWSYFFPLHTRFWSYCTSQIIRGHEWGSRDVLLGDVLLRDEHLKFARFDVNADIGPTSGKRNVGLRLSSESKPTEHNLTESKILAARAELESISKVMCKKYGRDPNSFPVDEE